MVTALDKSETTVQLLVCFSDRLESIGLIGHTTCCRERTFWTELSSSEMLLQAVFGNGEYHIAATLTSSGRHRPTIMRYFQRPGAGKEDLIQLDK